LIGIGRTSDRPVGKHQVTGQGRVNAPRLHETTRIGDNDRAHIDTPRVGLVSEREVGQWFVHRDVHGDVGGAA